MADDDLKPIDPYAGPAYDVDDEPELWTWEEYRDEALLMVASGFWPHEAEAAELMERLDRAKERPEEEPTEPEWRDAHERMSLPMSLEKLDRYLAGEYEPRDRTGAGD